MPGPAPGGEGEGESGSTRRRVRRRRRSRRWVTRRFRWWEIVAAVGVTIVAVTTTMWLVGTL